MLTCSRFFIICIFQIYTELLSSKEHPSPHSCVFNMGIVGREILTFVAIHADQILQCSGLTLTSVNFQHRRAICNWSSNKWHIWLSAWGQEQIPFQGTRNICSGPGTCRRPFRRAHCAKHRPALTVLGSWTTHLTAWAFSFFCWEQ